MIGAVIGDMAAWTWENDKESFYPKLISPKAELSAYGYLSLELYDTVQCQSELIKERVYPLIGKALLHKPYFCIIPDEWRNWGVNEYDKPIPQGLKTALISAAFVDYAFQADSFNIGRKFVNFFHGGKPDYYAAFCLKIIQRLREGATKDDAIKDIPFCVYDHYKSGEGHHLKWILDYITFAWRCFYYSYDFTSAIHNAMKCSENRHLAAFLTGAFAEAMYGCTYAMTKQKFKGSNEFIELPETIQQSYGKMLKEIEIKDFTERFFFPKNDALTNVESHTWTPVENPYQDLIVNVELRRRIMRAYHTGWEHRFGVYLDNGWFYIYRSHCLLYRFKLTQYAPEEWRITNLEKSNDPHGEIIAVDEVISSVESFWYNGYDNPVDNLYCIGDKKVSPNMKYCKYYRGETQCPKAFKNTVNEKFWYGEKMFIDNEIDLSQWIITAERVKNDLEPNKRVCAEKYSIETFAIICYIEMLFSKGCPNDSMEWIFEY